MEQICNWKSSYDVSCLIASAYVHFLDCFSEANNLVRGVAAWNAIRKLQLVALSQVVSSHGPSCLSPPRATGK